MDIGEARFTEEYRQFKGVVKDLERRLGSVIIQVYIPSQALMGIGTMCWFVHMEPMGCGLQLRTRETLGCVVKLPA